MVRRIVSLRRRHRLGPVAIGDLLGMPASTVHAVLVRCRLNRLTHLDRATGEPIRRYEHERPGDLLHVDVKKLGKVPDGGGWRYVGREQGLRNRSATSLRTGAPKSKYHQPLIGTCYLHTVIDDHSRVAYVEAHDDETKETATAVLRNAVAWFAARGVTVRRVLSDNGGAYRSHLWRDTCTELGITPKRTRPYRPQTNGKIERFHRTLVEGWAFKTFYPSESRPPRRAATMGPPVQPPPAPLSDRQGRTHHPVGQPGWASHLAVLGHEVVTAAGRWESAQCGVASTSVVLLEPWGKGGSPFVVAGEDLPVGPLGGQGAVEPLHLAVLPRAVRADELVLGADGFNRCFDVGALAVAEMVVGDHPLDRGDAMAGEEGRGAGDETGAGGALLVGQDLAVGQAGVVIDHGVHVVVADLDLLVGLGRVGRAAVGAPPAAVGDLADLLDVDVHHFPGPVAFVAHRGGLGGADHLTCDRIQQPQVRHVVAAQDACHGPGGHAQFVLPTILPTPMFSSSGQDRALPLPRWYVAGFDLGREERSASPASPSASNLATHRCAH